jgi:glyoxylase-like metal-dependent hydrolase (beta-lactamase superfamily II)
VILFEPHVFHRRTAGRWSPSSFSYARWRERPYPSAQQARWEQMADAAARNEGAALESASWGLFQIMGFHWRALGYASAESFALAMTKGELELTEPDDVRPLGDGEVLDLAGVRLRVDHAPGHTEGSVTFLADRDANRPPVFISGDLLFAGSIGRTDLSGGDPEAMMASLERVVLSLDDDTVVMPGHGQTTTIGVERTTNPFLRQVIEGRG